MSPVSNLFFFPFLNIEVWLIMSYDFLQLEVSWENPVC